MSEMRHPDGELERELRLLFDRAERPAAPRSLDALLNGLPERRGRLPGFSPLRGSRLPSAASLLRAFGALGASVAVVAVVAMLFGASFRFGASSAASAGAGATVAAASPSAGSSPAATALPSVAATGAASAAVSASAEASTAPAPSASTAASTAPGFISPEQALAAARLFLRDPGAVLTVDASRLTGADPTYLLVNDTVAVTVAGESGRVRSYYVPRNAPNGQAPAITLAQARAAADEFLALHSVGTAGLVPATAFDSSTHAYDVIWSPAEAPPSAAPAIAVFVNPVTSQVFAFRDFR